MIIVFHVMQNQIFVNNVKMDILEQLPQDVIDFYKDKGIYEQITSTDCKEKTFVLVDEILKKI